MRKYIKKIMMEAQYLLDSNAVTARSAADLERHIAYLCHERLVHLCVTLAFALLTMLSLIILIMFTGIGTTLLLIILFVMTFAYSMHYYFLENSVQKLYDIADLMHERIK